METRKTSESSEPKSPKRGVHSTEQVLQSLAAIKNVSLATLVVVNVALVFAISYSRSPHVLNHNTNNKFVDHNSLYLTSTAVALSEVLKLIASLVIEFWLTHQRRGWTFENCSVFLEGVKNDVLHIDTVKVGIPGILYVIENNLLFIALSNLSVAVYEVTDQVKILTTAVFSVYILDMKISRMQKLSLLCLTIGVAIVEFSSADHSSEASQATNNEAFGIAALLLACLISGFAGVYFEKVVKHGRKLSIYIRNVRLAIYGVCFGVLSVFITDENAVEKDGFFQGYTFTTWLVIALFAIGGVVNALVIKYANNILKGFAASIATVLTSVIVSFSSEFPLSNNFVFGSSLVVMSVFLYGSFPATSERTSEILDGGQPESKKLSAV